MMNVKTERMGDVLSADVEGRIDGSNVVQFEEAVRAVIENSDRAVIMNFEKLVYISSAGLRAILLTAKSLQKQDAKLLLCSLSDRIREVFEISGFDKILPIHATKDDALASLES
ncbi:MAG: STAS domain-containing protein [Rhodospirillaceae bacterium]|nr:STAS domain-containing protein [Rhodospirillaceae bacterium]